MFSTHPVEKKVEHLHHAVKHSFHQVKQDTTQMAQWIHFLHQTNQRQEQLLHRALQTINRLEKELSDLPKSPEAIKRVIDAHYSYDAILGRIRLIEQRLDDFLHRAPPSSPHVVPLPLPASPTMVQEPSPLHPALQELRSKVERLEKKKESMKERMAKRITRNSKEYVKTIILSYIQKYENVPALRLKEMVVEDQGLCSKSSFYRLMEEIEQEEDIGVVREGKEKKYFIKAAMRHR